VAANKLDGGLVVVFRGRDLSAAGGRWRGALGDSRDCHQRSRCVSAKVKDQRAVIYSAQEPSPDRSLAHHKSGPGRRHGVGFAVVVVSVASTGR
jgi:hypothetical protein